VVIISKTVLFSLVRVLCLSGLQTAAAVVFFSDLVPAPKQLTLERQLNKSVLIGWNPPDAPPGAIDSYHVYVDGVLKTTVKATERTRALVEGVDSTRVSSQL
jgi:RIMS-binding protein 2